MQPEFDTDNTHPDYVTVTSGLRGYFAIIVRWYDEYGYDVWNSSDFSSGDINKAIEDGKSWASAEGIEFRG